MARISLEELYRGEDASAKYGIMGEVMKDFSRMVICQSMTNGCGLRCSP